MPKLKNKPPKYSKLKNYAVVYHQGKIHYLGQYGSPESKTAYARFVAENRVETTLLVPKPEEGASVTVSELGIAFLDHTKDTLDTACYGHYKIIIGNFLFKLYGNDTLVNDFKPSCLKLVRSEMIQSRRFNRNTINKYIKRIVSMFTWGVEEELVDPNTALALKAVKSLQAGHPDTFEGKGREEVPDAVIRRTLPFMPPTLRAMVILQRLTGCRPSEIFNMRVGEIDQTRDTELWYYTPTSHKTKRFVKEKQIPLGKAEQKLLAPYLVGKKPEQAVFSPKTAMEERNAEKRANRKTKISPSQAARDKARATKPKQYAECYDRHSYYQAIEYAIKKGNKTLPEGEQIPHWFPYQIRHAAGTATEKTEGLDKAQALLGHRTANVTRRYAHSQLAIAEDMARNRVNPFDDAMDEEAAGQPQ